MAEITKTQERKIAALRARGLGCRKVAEIINVPENVVKYYFRLHKAPDTVIQCKNCGKEAVCIPTYKKKVFCSDKCRMDWWAKHQKEINHTMYTHICKTCGCEFKSFRKDSVTCSKKCTGALKRKDVN